MENINMSEYERLKSMGPVGVSIHQGEITYRWNVLIMGPTGAGKSTFIEALGWNGDQRISSSHLDSYTQTISTYRVNNLTSADGSPIRLVDSPGFADTRTSESAIVAMLKKWLQDNQGASFDRIFYLIPITHARLSGSQRQVLKTFQALTGIKSSEDITIVTTMWDSIYGEATLKRAEGTFQQLRDEIWKEYIDAGTRIVKFRNTLQSALSILNLVLVTGGGDYFHIEKMVDDSQNLHETPFGTRLFTDLQDRIQNLQSARSTLLLDLEQARLPNEAELQALLLQQLQQIEDDLARFQKELDNLGPPSSFTASPQVTAAFAHRVNITPDDALMYPLTAAPPPLPFRWAKQLITYGCIRSAR